jgi:hypothetical protein
MNPLTTKCLGKAIGIAAFSLCAAQAALAANITIGINQPGVYGRVTLGEPIPQQAWVYQEPTVITPLQYGMQRQPIYLYVPAAQSSNWGRYCKSYNACAQPVIFVQDRWVRERHEQYVQQYPGQRGRGRALGHDRDHDGVKNGRDKDRDGDGVRNSRDRQPNNPYRN